ncbi:MAG: hypothetical protein OHK0040_13710 [bacterium]
MAFGYLILVIIGIGLIVTGFYGAFVYKGNKSVSIAMSLLMPVGLIVAVLGILLTVLPNFFQETVIW